MQNIQDPRKYSEVYPQSNIIINLAMQILKGNGCLSDLQDAIDKNLKNNNDALINVAINLAPNLEVSKLIWDELNFIINGDNINGKKANIFAIPLVLVAGAKTKVKLKSQLETNLLNQFFYEKKIFIDGVEGFISAKLIDPGIIAKITPSQLYYWVRNSPNAKLGLPINMDGISVEVLNEGVFLRFLTGITISTSNNKNIKLGLSTEQFNQHSMDLMRLIHQELNVDGVTLFPIPFSPVTLSSAAFVGNNYRKEIALQVAFSAIVRKIRENSLTPYATIMTEDDALKIIITTKESSNFEEVSIWQLNRIDDFKNICGIIINLLEDIKVEWTYANFS